MKHALLLASKESKRDMTFEELKKYMSGVTLKTQEDYIKARQWFYSADGPIKGWYFYWQRGIDGRDKTP